MRTAHDPHSHEPGRILQDPLHPQVESGRMLAQTLFVDATHLREHWTADRPYAILADGFGSGAAFFAVLAAWRNSPRRAPRLDYLTVQQQIPARAEILACLSRLGIAKADRQRIASCWPLPLPGLHRIAFESGQVVLTIAIGDPVRMITRLDMVADAFHFSGECFAHTPSDADRRGHARRLARLARRGALVSAIGLTAPQLDALREAGFHATEQAQQAGALGAYIAQYRPAARRSPRLQEVQSWPTRRVLVVGGGLAGAAVSAGFAAAGCAVVLAERGPPGLNGGSAQTRLAAHLHLSSDDNRLARLSRCALGLSPAGPLLAEAMPADATTGKLMLAGNARQQQTQQRLIERLAVPAQFACTVTAAEASDIAGLPLTRAALWLPRVESIDPLARCRHWLGSASISVRWHLPVDALWRDGEVWRLRSPPSDIENAFDLVVLCNAGDALRLAGMRSATLTCLRGQSTHVSSAMLASLRCNLGADGYVCPLAHGESLVGASYDSRESREPDPADDLDNLRRTANMLDLPISNLAARIIGATTGFRWNARDRLPLIGWVPDEALAHAQSDALLRNAKTPLPRIPGMMIAAGFGSRGALWASLAGALLPAIAHRLPLPIESDLAASIDPARFLREALRTGALN